MIEDWHMFFDVFTISCILYYTEHI